MKWIGVFVGIFLFFGAFFVFSEKVFACNCSYVFKTGDICLGFRDDCGGGPNSCGLNPYCTCPNSACDGLLPDQPSCMSVGGGCVGPNFWEEVGSCGGQGNCSGDCGCGCGSFGCGGGNSDTSCYSDDNSVCHTSKLRSCGSRTDANSCNGTAGCTWYSTSVCGPGRTCTGTYPNGTCDNICGGGIACVPPCTNTAPAAVTLLTPANGTTKQPLSLSLVLSQPADYAWGMFCGGGDVHTLTFYLGGTAKCTSTANPANSNTISASCPITGLSYDTVYSWYVVAQNGNGIPTTSPTWTFRTIDFPAWWQATEGDIFAGGTVQSQIPTTCVGTCKAWIELD